MDMRNLVVCTLLSFASLRAQNISGNWQGTLGEGTDDKLRLLLQISKVHNACAATLISVDQTRDRSFEGTVNPDGASINGSWIQGGYPFGAGVKWKRRLG